MFGKAVAREELDTCLAHWPQLIEKIERAGLEGLLVFIPTLPAEPVGRGEESWPP